MENLINSSLIECREALSCFMNAPDTVRSMEKAVLLIAEALQKGNKIISCGNGGSLCDATHFAEELTGRYRNDRQPLPAIAINDPAYLTCVGNDYGFEHVFSRYVNGVGKEGDVLLAISTSGKSVNVLQAMSEARKNHLSVICLTGKITAEVVDLSDVVIGASYGEHSDRVQEIHIKVIHILIQAVEDILRKKLT